MSACGEVGSTRLAALQADVIFWRKTPAIGLTFIRIFPEIGLYCPNGTSQQSPGLRGTSYPG